LTLEEKLKNLPIAPGVYLHKDAGGKIIYVGKAKNLRNRVRSYFQSGRGHDRKTRELVKRITDLEFIVTDTEVEAQAAQAALQRAAQGRQAVPAPQAHHLRALPARDDHAAHPARRLALLRPLPARRARAPHY
jgi:hypothetical protein